MEYNGPESNLPGFLLNNEQMFWISYVIKRCTKEKRGVFQNPAFATLDRYFELNRVFNCSTAPEEDDEEYSTSVTDEFEETTEKDDEDSTIPAM